MTESTNIATFSIIIPTYNSAMTLAVSLESIAQQSYKNVEVIIMDGVSTDKTLAIAEEFKVQIPKLNIYSEKDRGIYDAMNKAMDKATGKWLFFMGSDDSFYTNEVLNQVAQIIETSHTKVIYGDAHIIGDTGWAKDGDIYDGEFTLQKLINQNICHQAMFYNREFIKIEVGYFNLAYKKSSDWDFNLRCWAKYPIEYIDLIITNFLAGGFSTYRNDKSLAKDFVDNIMDYFRVNLFHPLLNTPNFVFYGNVVKKQKEKHAIRYLIEKIKKYLFK
jgi:glycosyltransferase involved in cell wall biosynthesis